MLYLNRFVLATLRVKAVKIVNGASTDTQMNPKQTHVGNVRALGKQSKKYICLNIVHFNFHALLILFIIQPN